MRSHAGSQLASVPALRCTACPIHLGARAVKIARFVQHVYMSRESHRLQWGYEDGRRKQNNCREPAELPSGRMISGSA